MGKILIGIIIVGCLGAGAYLILQNDNSFRVSFLGMNNNISSTTSQASTSTTQNSSSSGILEGAQAIGDQAWSVVQDAGMWIKNGVGDLFSSVASSTKSTLTQKAKNVAQETIQSVQNTLGIGSSTASNSSLFISYIIHLNTSVSFVVHNPFLDTNQETLDYSINWGDGSTESEKNIKAKDNYTFTHLWQKEGDYTISFAISNGDKENTYTIHVVVQ